MYFYPCSDVCTPYKGLSIAIPSPPDGFLLRHLTTRRVTKIIPQMTKRIITTMPTIQPVLNPDDTEMNRHVIQINDLFTVKLLLSGHDGTGKFCP